MANTAVQNSAGTKPSGLNAVRAWAVRNRHYFAAFILPVILLYIAYAIFGLTPFGDRSVLCLDLNGQYVYYFEAIRDAFWGDGSILYNWTRNLSGDYSGIIGYYLASPFTLIVILLPRTMILVSLLIMILCKLGAASAAMCYYLTKSKHLSPLYAVLLSVGFGMCAYGVIQTIDPMWLDGLVCLPLIALGVEYLVDDGRKINYIIPLALICVANFYIGFMCCIFTAFYFLFYVCFGSNKVQFNVKGLLPVLGRMVLATAVAMCLAAFMILPVYNALSLGKFDFTTPDYSFKTQFTTLEFLAQFSVNQYNSVNVQGRPEIYCGVLAFLTLPLFFLNTRIQTRKKIGYAYLLLVMFFSMWIKPVDMLWHGGQVPNWLPFRYSFIFSFILLSMAGMTLKAIRGIKKPALLASFVGIGIVMLLADSKDYLDAKNNVYLDTATSVWATILFAAAYALLLFFLSRKNVPKRTATWLTLSVLIISGAELTWNAVNSFKDIHTEVCYSTKKSYNEYVRTGRELVDRIYSEDPSFYRAEKTYVRTVNDNGGFGLRGMTHSSSVMNTKILKFIEAMGYSCRSYYSRYDGNTALADSILGIKYVMDKGDDNRNLNPTYTLRFTDTCKGQNEEDIEVGVYENPNALSMGYMVNKDIQRVNAFGNDNPFNSQNILMSTITGNTTFTSDGQFDQWREYYYPIPLTNELRLNEVYSEPYGVQTNYRANPDATDPTIDIFFEAQTSDPIYIFFKTENESKVNLWMADQWNLDEPVCKNVDGSDGKFMGSYFETDNYHILLLGSFEPGQKLQLRMTLLTDGNGKEKYTIVKNFFFYHFNQALYQQDIDTLKDQQWNLTKAGGRVLEGTIKASDNQVMMTSVPFEPGWTVWVDGQKVEHLELFKAMIGVPLSPGEHTVKMKFTPVGLRLGLILLILGLFGAVAFWLYDRKHNKMIALIRENRAKGIYELPYEDEITADKKILNLAAIKAFLKSDDEEDDGKKREEKKTEDTAKSTKAVEISSVADEIRKMKALYDEGVLTEEEFEAQKKKLLNR